MDTRRRDLASLRARLLEQQVSREWIDPEDLGRFSVESFIDRDADFRTIRSTGALRFTGDGLSGAHSMSFQNAAFLMSDWQRLVTAIGAAQAGFKSLTGQLSAAIQDKTRLLLNASPSPGSVILNFTPAMDPVDELAAGGQAQLVDQPTEQQIDAAVLRALDLMNFATSTGPDLDATGLMPMLEELGPRTTSALASLADLMNAAQLNTDVTWRQPGRASVRAIMSSETAHLLSEAIKNRELESETVTLTGTLETLSVRSSLVIADPATQEHTTIRRGKLDREALESFHLGESVRVICIARFTRRPGDEPHATYEAQSIHRMAEPRQS